MSQPYGHHSGGVGASPDASSAPNSQHMLNEKPAYGGAATKKGVSPWIKFGLPIVAVLVIVGAVVGGVVGSRAANNNKNAAAAGSANAGGSSSSTGSTGTGSTGSSGSSAKGSSGTSSASAAAATATGKPITNLASWNWGKDKAVGMCLGNWLILERWMNEDWFIEKAGADSWDQWDFVTAVGSNATAVLQEHYNTWVTVDDIELMFQNGINNIRIPTGFWSWIPTVSGEPYINAGEINYLNKIVAAAYERGMYILIDLHGLPGSQNGEESSGHNTTLPTLFGNSANWARSDDTVKAVISWIETNPYRSAISGFEVINEPRPYTTAQNQELSSFYQRSYDAIQASAWPVAMFIHGAFIADAQNYWSGFAEAHATDPPSLVYEDHPYPGNFPPQTNSADILTQVCTAAQKYVGYPIPICITEWSVYTGVKTTAFEKQFYESQATAWAWSAGGFYWSYRLIPSQLQLAAGLDYSQYSFVTLVQNATDTIPTPSSVSSVSNTTTSANAAAYLAGLTSNCGNAPDNAAPYNNGTFTTNPWTAESSALSVAATVTLRATATARRARKF